MKKLTTLEKIKILRTYLTQERWKRISKVLSYRTRYLNIILENIYQPHNASAVLRSCEAYGIQDVHILEQESAFSPVPTVAMGSSKWLTLYHHRESISEIYAKLRKKGYSIYATCPHENARSIDSLNLSNDKRISIVFGNELKGLSEEAIEQADETLYLPMYGFVESFNISVSVAIALSYLVQKMKENNIDWQLTENEKEQILLEWLCLDVHKAEEILKKHEK